VASKKSKEMGRRGKFRAWTTGEGELSGFKAAPRAGARAPVGVQAHLNGSLLAVAAGVIGVDAGLEALLAFGPTRHVRAESAPNQVDLVFDFTCLLAAVRQAAGFLNDARAVVSQ
jgi:hypothetical protein